MPTASKEPARSLVTKLTKIANEIGDKDPKKHSKAIQFPYHAARDVYGWWRAALHRENILLVPDIRESTVTPVELPRSGGGTRKTFLTTVIMDFLLIDGGTGETVRGSAVGHGEDPSDKGSGKAMTYAEKSFLLGLGMNGADTDVEAVPDDGGREHKVEIEGSNITGIARGGHSDSATGVQVRRVAELARDLGYDPDAMAEVIEVVTGKALELPEDPGEHGAAVRKRLEGETSESIGQLIQYMEVASDNALAEARGAAEY